MTAIIQFMLAVGLLAAPDTIPYNLSYPERFVFFHQPELYEISGLGVLPSPDKLLAINDEKGEFYIVNPNTGVIERSIFFREKGDFEGVEWYGSSLFAVKSDGTLFELADWDKPRPKLHVYETRLTRTNDVEGLCYDPGRHALLLACKEAPESDKLRGVYAFDLKTKTLSESPVYTVDPRHIQALTPQDPKDKGRFFSPSGIAIHPISGDVYLISTAKKALAVLDYNTGALKYASALDRKVFPQPEGICFDAQGNMYISNEGKEGEPTSRLLRFDYRGAPARNSKRN